MKLRSFLPIALILFLMSCSSSYKSTSSSAAYANVPTVTRTAFVVQYPDATDVVWTPYSDTYEMPIDWDLAGWPALSTGDYVVRFNQNHDNYYAWYDANGNWIGSYYLISDQKFIPSSIHDMLDRDYSGYTITSVNREMKKDAIAYEVQLKNNNSKIKLLVDENGNVLRKKDKIK